MQAGILNIGDEILIGQINNINASFIAHNLNAIGVQVKKILVVGDEKKDIVSAFGELLKICDIVIVTGGLGTTNDDITKNCICQYFNRKLVKNELVFNYLQEIIRFRYGKLSDNVLEQAILPENCEAIPNEIGTAPGIWIENKGKILVSIPGVPQEMQAMLYIILEKMQTYSLDNQNIIHKHIQTIGISESLLSDKLIDFEKKLPSHIKLAYLPKTGYISLRLTGCAPSTQSLETELQKQVLALSQLVKKYIFSYEDKTLPQLIVEKLTEKKQTLALAESCTGGYIAHLITSLAGCSEYFKGGIIAYSNEIKNKVLQVENQLINLYGAVSEKVVVQMATNLLSIYNVDYGIAVSGIAGPSGGSEEKPVGTVWIAVADKNRVNAKCFSFGNGRERVIGQTTMTALCMLYRLF
jgi:nicotinamide-nucleotide amidase